MYIDLDNLKFSYIIIVISFEKWKIIKLKKKINNFFLFIMFYAYGSLK